MNRETIAVEIALKEDKKSGFWVERPNEKQWKSGKILGDFLSKKHSINKENFLTSKDPLLKSNWEIINRKAHVDDFNETDRKTLGIPSQAQQVKFIAKLRREEENKNNIQLAQN